MLVVCLYRDLTEYLRLGAKLEQVLSKKQNRKEKGRRVYTDPCCVYWAVFHQLGKPSCLWKSKCKRMSFWKSWVYIIVPCHVVGSKHTVKFAWDKIKCTDIVDIINHVTFLTNRFSRLISLPTSTIFVSETSESVSYFLEFSCITAILEI